MIIPGFPTPLIGRSLTIEDVQSLPPMTSNTAPAGQVASASSVGFGEAWQVFDQSSATIWSPTTGVTTNQWVQRQVPSPITVYRYRVTSQDFSSGPARSPNDFELQGSNNGSSFTTLDLQIGQTWVQGETKTFDVASPGSYLYYRLFMLTNNGGDRFAIAELELLQAK